MLNSSRFGIPVCEFIKSINQHQYEHLFFLSFVRTSENVERYRAHNFTIELYIILPMRIAHCLLLWYFKVMRSFSFRLPNETKKFNSHSMPQSCSLIHSHQAPFILEVQINLSFFIYIKYGFQMIWWDIGRKQINSSSRRFNMSISAILKRNGFDSQQNCANVKK